MVCVHRGKDHWIGIDVVSEIACNEAPRRLIRTWCWYHTLGNSCPRLDSMCILDGSVNGFTRRRVPPKPRVSRLTNRVD